MSQVKVNVQIKKTPVLVVTVSVYDGGSGPAPRKVTLRKAWLHPEHGGGSVGAGAGVAWDRLARARRAALIVNAFITTT